MSSSGGQNLGDKVVWILEFLVEVSIKNTEQQNFVVCLTQLHGLLSFLPLMESKLFGTGNSDKLDGSLIYSCGK